MSGTTGRERCNNRDLLQGELCDEFAISTKREVCAIISRFAAVAARESRVGITERFPKDGE